jgi:uncharacterized membrane protein
VVSEQDEIPRGKIKLNGIIITHKSRRIVLIFFFTAGFTLVIKRKSTDGNKDKIVKRMAVRLIFGYSYVVISLTNTHRAKQMGKRATKRQRIFFSITYFPFSK